MSNINGDSFFISSEVLPTLKNDDFNSSVNRAIEFNKELQPLFCSIPWRYPFPVSKDSCAVRFAIQLQSHGQEVMQHISCQGLTKDNARETLSELKRNGITNIFALRGDKRVPISKDVFPYAKDLVKFIREEFGSCFKICVAGYPSGHPESSCKSEDLKYLKEKVNAGADFIITQIVFDANEFIQFVKDCRIIGIQIPIIPGVLPIQNFEMIERVCGNCCVTMPTQLKQKYDSVKNQDVFENFSIQTTVDLIIDIVNELKVPGVHIFTLNRPEFALKIKKALSTSIIYTKLKPK